MNTTALTHNILKFQDEVRDELKLDLKRIKHSDDFLSDLQAEVNIFIKIIFIQMKFILIIFQEKIAKFNIMVKQCSTESGFQSKYNIMPATSGS